MGHWVKCEKCNKTGRYHSSEVKNTGTVWHNIWVIKCRNCDFLITHDAGKSLLFREPGVDDILLALETKANITITSPQLRECAESGDIREYWVQQYVKNNYEKLGFSEIAGPFDEGPDFKGVYGGKSVYIEVERVCGSYVEHGHHQDRRFEEVEVLIVLGKSNLTDRAKKKLPNTIVQINIDDFMQCLPTLVKDYTTNKRLNLRIKLLAGEFYKRFHQNCDNKERQLSACTGDPDADGPPCGFCPYSGKPDDFFLEMALRFVSFCDHQIASYDFNLSDIAPSEIDMFYERFVENRWEV